MLTNNKSICDILKEDIKKHIDKLVLKDKVVDEEDTIVLYHGTNSVYLNDIIENGIQPRKLTGNHNWSEDERAYSNEHLVYLTNKWHYKYAYVSLNKLLEAKYGEEWSANPKARWWKYFNPLPIYFKCNVPKSRLVIDEDIVYSNYVKNKVKSALKRGTDLNLNLNWEDSLKHSGTVGFVGTIKPEWIESIVVLGSPKMYLELEDEKGQYNKDWSDWASGKGKGKLKNKDLKEIEKKYYPLVGTIKKPIIPKGYKISQIVPQNGKLTYILNKIEDLSKQPINLEKY